MRSAVAGRTLLDAAGSLPVAQRETAGTTPVTADPMADRTIYCVVETFDAAGSYNAIATMGTGGGRLVFQTAGPGDSGMSVRVDTDAGTVNGGRTLSGYRPGRRVLAAWARSGMTLAGLHGTPELAIIPGSGMGSANLTLHSPYFSTVPIAALAFLAFHDLATRRRVMDWLARRYGATPPQA